MNSVPTPTGSFHDKSANQLRDEFAHYIQSRQAPLLERWRDHTLRDPKITTASSLARKEFEDHIPVILKLFCVKLRSAPDSASQQNDEREAGEEHGAHRWQQGYFLQEMVREWGLLNVVLVEEIDSCGFSHPAWTPGVLPAARHALAELVTEGVCAGVTQFSRLQQAEAQARANDLESALEHLQVVARERGEMLRNASHDLRGGLSAVQGAASLLDDSFSLSASERGEMVQIVQTGVDNLDTMLTAMLDLARLEAGHEERNIEVFDAGQLLKNLCAASMATATQSGLSLRTCGADNLMVEGDAIKVRRIAQNLLLNALKYTEKGDVLLQWREGSDGAENDEDQAQSGPKNCDRWTLTVSDTGPGMPGSSAAPIAQKLKDATDSAREIGAQSGPDHPENPTQNPASAHTAASTPDAPASFTINDSVARATAVAVTPGGEGIGLTIVKRLCELLDATLELDSSAHQGSTFRVVFPMKYEG